MSLFIADGYTLEATIPAKGRLPELTFRYRPCLPETVYEYLSTSRNSGKETMKVHADLILKQVVSWDAVNNKDEVVPITLDVLKRVPYQILEQMINFITGYGPEEQVKDLKN